MFNPTIIIRLSILIAVLLPSPGTAQCQIDASDLYTQFRDYRLALDSAQRPKDLAKYFTDEFNRYYQQRLSSTTSQAGEQNYLSEYWKNLNTAKDIIMVLFYDLDCKNQQVTLQLHTILAVPKNEKTDKVDIWLTRVYYRQESGKWLINSFEYEKSPHTEFPRTEIVDSFVTIR